MSIKCPHCGTEYDIAQHEFGKFVTCQICGKGFVTGAKAQAKSTEHGNQTSRPKGPLSGKIKRSSAYSNGMTAMQPSDRDVKFITPVVAMVLQMIGYVVAILCGFVGFCSGFLRGGPLDGIVRGLVIVLATILACLGVRLWYEFIIIIFEGVAYLRQVRDELRLRKM